MTLTLAALKQPFVNPQTALLHVPACVPQIEQAAPLLPWVQSRFLKSQDKASWAYWQDQIGNKDAEGFEGWLKYEGRLFSEVPLPFRTPNFNLRSVGLDHSSLPPDIRSLAFGYVDPTQIHGLQSGRCLDRDEGFLYFVGGSFFVCGFGDDQARSNFMDGVIKMLPEEARAYNPGGIHFNVAGWKYAGTSRDDRSLALITPVAFSALLSATEQK